VPIKNTGQSKARGPTEEPYRNNRLRSNEESEYEKEDSYTDISVLMGVFIYQQVEKVSDGR
jgi:hypothetical protein